MKVIIADDSVFIRDRMQQMLHSFGQVEIVGIFNNGTDALQALKTLKPDLAIVDIKMPGLNGLEVLKEIRRENKTLRFIIFTFQSIDDYGPLAMKAGADYFFSKVDDFDRVEQVVNDMLNVKLNQTK